MSFKMGKYLSGVAVAALALAAGSAVANADDSAKRQGWYVGLEAGWVGVSDTSLVTSGIIAPSPTRVPVSFDGDAVYLGTLGYDFASNWRMELEIGYRDNDLTDKTTVCTTACVVTTRTGSMEETTAFLNVLYDLPLSSRLLLNLGAGVGVDQVRFHDNTTPPTVAREDKDTEFAMQAIAGLTYRLSGHWDLMANYRYLYADDPELRLASTGRPATMDVRKHEVTIGFRYGYDEPEAVVEVPPPPPPPPPPAKQFIIFFGFNKCNITAEADAVLSEAAAAARSQGSASVRIVGHTDSSGSNGYNQKLSECRANAAKSNLAGKGIAEGSMSTSGKGESELMVQTGDGVKEPQNRRATVDLN